jgi:hypothetical protein
MAGVTKAPTLQPEDKTLASILYSFFFWRLFYFALSDAKQLNMNRQELDSLSNSLRQLDAGEEKAAAGTPTLSLQSRSDQVSQIYISFKRSPWQKRRKNWKVCGIAYTTRNNCSKTRIGKVVSWNGNNTDSKKNWCWNSEV